MKEDVINFLGLLVGASLGLLGAAWLVKAFRTDSLAAASIGILLILISISAFIWVSKKVK